MRHPLDHTLTRRRPPGCLRLRALLAVTLPYPCPIPDVSAEKLQEGNWEQSPQSPARGVSLSTAADVQTAPLYFVAQRPQGVYRGWGFRQSLGIS